MEARHVDGNEFKSQLSPSCFKDLVMCWEFGRNSFWAAYGYSVLEILVKFKENPRLVSKIWEFFERDEQVRKKAKDEGKFELFLCFKKLLTFVFVGNFISDVDELRIFLCSKKYWIICVEYYFSIADLSKIPVYYLIYSNENYEIYGKLPENAPLVLVCQKEHHYFPADLTDFEYSDFKFPFEYHPDMNLLNYRN